VINKDRYIHIFNKESYYDINEFDIMKKTFEFVMLTLYVRPV